MAQAQSNGETKAFVTVSELQSVLHRLAALESEKALRDIGTPKLAGYVIGDHLRNVLDRGAMFAKMKRKKGGNCTTALYFLEIEGEDTRLSYAQALLTDMKDTATVEGPIGYVG